MLLHHLSMFCPSTINVVDSEKLVMCLTEALTGAAIVIKRPFARSYAFSPMTSSTALLTS